MLVRVWRKGTLLHLWGEYSYYEEQYGRSLKNLK